MLVLRLSILRTTKGSPRNDLPGQEPKLCVERKGTITEQTKGKTKKLQAKLNRSKGTFGCLECGICLHQTNALRFSVSRV